jgi:transposase
MSADNRFYEMQDRETPRLLVPSLRQAVEDDPEVLALEAAVGALDLSGVEAQYAWVGHPAYPPAVMLKVLLYGYSTGLRSSRQLERACKRDDAFRYLAGGLRPDHNSICRFRRRHAEQLPDLFAQAVHLCQAAGLVSLGEVALDGTKLRANRSKAGLHGAQHLVAALQEAEAADGGEVEASEECAFLKAGEGIVPAYNAQVAVDGTSQVIVACEVDTAANDQGHLAPLVEQVVETCGAVPEKVLADGSYANNAGIGEVEEGGSEVYVPVREPGQAQVEWVEEEGAYRCLAGQWLRPKKPERGRLVYAYYRCHKCSQRVACGVTGKHKKVYVWPADSPVGRVRARLQTEAGQTVYARRKAIVEPVFGGFKHNRGFRRLLLRGRSGARIEWTLVCLAHNLRKWAQAAGPGAPWPGLHRVWRVLHSTARHLGAARRRAEHAVGMTRWSVLYTYASL